MAENKKRARKKGGKRQGDGRAADKIRVRRAAGRGEFELVPPRCALERAEDLEEVRVMLKAGEVQIAVDELRWLLAGCGALLEAHQLLGQIALDDGDLPLARGHFGYAFELGMRAIPQAGLSGVLPHARPANRAFLESGKSLAECLKRLGKTETAAEVVRQVLALDPSDPLGARALLENGGPSPGDTI